MKSNTKMHYPVAPNLKENTEKAFPETVNNFGSLPSNVVEDSTLSKALHILLPQ